MVKFSISEKEKQFELNYGLYQIFLSGGFSIENLDLLDISLVDEQTSEMITLKEKFLKPRRFINGERAICCFEFQINKFSRYKMKIKNPEVLVMKNSMLISINFIRSLFQRSNSSWKNINVIVE